MNSVECLPVGLLPSDRELIECVRDAACLYFNVSREQLLTDPRLVTARHLCFFLIHNATSRVLDYQIGAYFNRKRTAVNYGIAQVCVQRRIYRQTLVSLNEIGSLANNFDKKYEWHLQKISTTL